jgi:hypothetical protein
LTYGWRDHPHPAPPPSRGRGFLGLSVEGERVFGALFQER